MISSSHTENISDDNTQNKDIIFDQICIHILHVFDLGVKFYKRPDIRKTLSNHIFRAISSHKDSSNTFSITKLDNQAYDRDISKKLYDLEFINKINQSKPFEITFHINFDKINLYDYCKDGINNIEEIQNKIQNIDSFNSIPTSFMVESYGIGILKTKWDFTGQILSLNQAIDIPFFLQDILDKELFNGFFLPNIIRNMPFNSTTNYGFSYLNECLTEAILISKDSPQSYLNNELENDFYQQISQIVWLLPSHLPVSKNFSSTIESRNVSLIDKNVFIISRPISVGMFEHGWPEGHISDYINLIEILYCQYFLLKHLDYQLNHIIDFGYAQSYDGHNDQTKDIKSIIDIQQQSQIFTEFYRNSHIASYSEFRTLLDVGNDIFNLHSLYNSVKEKIEYSQSIIIEELNQIRNRKLDYLQWAGVGFAAITVSEKILYPILSNWLFTDTSQRPLFQALSIFILSTLVIINLYYVISAKKIRDSIRQEINLFYKKIRDQCVRRLAISECRKKINDQYVHGDITHSEYEYKLNQINREE
ncbi:MAG: hypothetical protein ETSY1_41560 [Candidatus Entotheonella factor]|uniref:Uncharacterized protein n=1 Tax=Entotheonella factor TaxID=1429438 RepID=W4L4A0_ENTF1|nr:MAG: hypothetical protein ETSY1_41560 [Candidatus Entotheonella factor]